MFTWCEMKMFTVHGHVAKADPKVRAQTACFAYKSWQSDCCRDRSENLMFAASARPHFTFKVGLESFLPTTSILQIANSDAGQRASTLRQGFHSSRQEPGHWQWKSAPGKLRITAGPRFTPFWESGNTGCHAENKAHAGTARLDTWEFGWAKALAFIPWPIAKFWRGKQVLPFDPTLVEYQYEDHELTLSCTVLTFRNASATFTSMSKT